MPSPLTRVLLTQTSRPVDVVAHWRDAGYLHLTPPYQRGEVWGPIRKRNLIRSLLMGIPIPSVIVNDRFHAGWGDEIVVIDGKQRMITILNFLDGALEVPGDWFGLDSETVTYGALPQPMQRRFRMTPIQCAEGCLKSIAEEAEVFELVNFGGVPQGQSDND